MTIFRVKKHSALGLTLNTPGRYKTREAAQRRADNLNDKVGHLRQYYVVVETEAEKDVAEAFAQLRKTGRARL